MAYLLSRLSCSFRMSRKTLLLELHCSLPISGRHYSDGGLRGTLSTYWSSLEWFSIPASVGFAYICSVQLHKVWKRERHKVVSQTTPEEQLLSEWQVSLLSQLPFRWLSRTFGWTMQLPIPVWLRSSVYGLYMRSFSCNLDEAERPNASQYANMQDFFTRKLKPGVRPIDNAFCLVSPADGQVMECGEVTDTFMLEQVKGITYPLSKFLGPDHPFMDTVKNALCKKSRNQSKYHNTKDKKCEKEDKKDKQDVGLFYCLVYLSPGDYHWFHSPCRWTITHRRHIPGNLFPVKPWALRSIQGVFNVNERVLLTGENARGDAVMFGAVGAYNVGSINMEFEKDLVTNKHRPNSDYDDSSYGAGLCVDKGAPLGHFKFGSSIVLVFTAPKDFKFCVERGATVKYGSALGDVSP